MIKSVFRTSEEKEEGNSEEWRRCGLCSRLVASVEKRNQDYAKIIIHMRYEKYQST